MLPSSSHSLIHTWLRSSKVPREEHRVPACWVLRGGGAEAVESAVSRPGGLRVWTGVAAEPWGNGDSWGNGCGSRPMAPLRFLRISVSGHRSPSACAGVLVGQGSRARWHRCSCRLSPGHSPTPARLCFVRHPSPAAGSFLVIISVTAGVPHLPLIPFAPSVPLLPPFPPSARCNPSAVAFPAPPTPPFPGSPLPPTLLWSSP